MARHYLIQDPYHPYATRFIEHFYRKYGYRAICFYTDRRERIRHERLFPILRAECVAASYDINVRDLARFAAHIASRHAVVAVVPYNEPAVLPATELARRLGLGWAQPEAMLRLQNKFALKEHLRREHPEIRMNASRLVNTVEDVLAAQHDPAYQRFVLKPNSGFGNRNIGIFGSTSSADEIERFLRGIKKGTQVLVEQYIDGAEYFVNGQIDAHGKVDVVAIFQYVRVPANGRDNLDFETLLVPRRDPRFEGIARYTEQVLRATGLRRSPFHLELKTDEAGPCLVEVGARLAGLGNAFLCEDLHGSRLDVFDVAAHYYLEPTDYGPLPLDWVAYDSAAVRYVHGIATRRERIYDLQGVPEIEALPQFHKWVRKPAVGAQLVPTLDSLSMPFSLVLKAPTQEQLSHTAADVRRLLRWNHSTGLGRRVAREAKYQMLRYAAEARARVLSSLEQVRRMIEPITRVDSLATLLQRARSLFGQALEALSRRWQLLKFAVRGAPRHAPEHPALTESVFRWARQYLGRPHAKLGRPGPICPFVQQTLERGQFRVRCYDDIDDGNIRRLRRIILNEARSFLESCRTEPSGGRMASLVLVFPKLPEAKLKVLDRVHDELKAHRVEKHDLMFSAFHKLSTKPSISNPDFAVFRAPFPMLAIRHMDVRDIMFLGHNPRSFRRYRARFGELYERGEVSDEFGLVRRYLEACARFGVSHPVGPAAQNPTGTDQLSVEN